jgi:hypothetical protein
MPNSVNALGLSDLKGVDSGRKIIRFTISPRAYTLLGTRLDLKWKDISRKIIDG